MEANNLIATVSGAPRGQGKFTAHFDGTDSAGEPLPEGTYTPCPEAAHKSGTCQLIRHELESNRQPIAKQKLKGNIKVGAVMSAYTPSTAKQLPAVRSSATEAARQETESKP
ncbi:putative periplasmic protein [Fuerstiella marisgermanici]|uniref:Putative periplasmic protein n=1 Tax=Fuerstiella marisgermanici TaxID=1891926 RepID=A0A1P8WR59_9PLAN|nr:putative periplasmic protein [Fuerstiella marisgermanici]